MDDAGKMVVRQFATRLGRGMLDLCFPLVCTHCGNQSESGLLCTSCRALLTRSANTPACPRCAATIGPFALRDDGCDICHKSKFAFEQVIRLGRYDGELRHACLRLKTLAGYHLGQALGDLLWQTRAQQLTMHEPHVVTPIPLHFFRRIRRGYNQVYPIAQQISRSLQISLATRLLQRRRRTAKQFQLSPTERERNLRNAFVCDASNLVGGKTVLLVDDILTTGATCHQAARALKQAGAHRVIVAVIARGDHVRQV